MASTASIVQVGIRITFRSRNASFAEAAHLDSADDCPFLPIGLYPAVNDE